MKQDKVSKLFKISLGEYLLIKYLKERSEYEKN
jgi:hypothetical protein